MTSADFCAFSTVFRQWLLLSEHTAQISLGTTHFFPSIYLPHLLHTVPCGYWALTCLAVLPPHTAFYVISVRQTRGLPPPSFRFHFAVNTLGLGYDLPTTGRSPDFHRLETCAARRTKESGKGQSLTFTRFFLIRYLNKPFVFPCRSIIS